MPPEEASRLTEDIQTALKQAVEDRLSGSTMTPEEEWSRAIALEQGRRSKEAA